MAALLGTSCEKSNGTIGAGKFEEDRPELGEKLSFQVLSTTEVWDSVASTNPTKVILGKYKDPEFGIVNSAFATRFLLANPDPEFGPNTICDSVKVRLTYSGTYGIPGDSLHVVVRPLTQAFIDSLVYYSNNEQPALVSGSTRILADTTLLLDPSAIIFNGVDSMVNTLAFDLDPTYFQEVLFDASIAGESYLASNEDFVAEVPGLWFEDMGNGTNAAAYFSLSASGTLINAYYRTSEDDTIASVYTMTFGQNFGDPSMSANYFFHDFSEAQFDLSFQDSVEGEPLVYTQGGCGARVALTIPFLDTLIGKGYSINRAELRVKVNQGSVGPYALPGTLLLLENYDTTFAPIKDYTSTINPTGGTAYQANLREFGYTFNVTRMVHDFVNSKERTLPLIITPSSGSTNLHRAVLGGGLHPTDPMEFSVYYTKSE